MGALGLRPHSSGCRCYGMAYMLPSWWFLVSAAAWTDAPREAQAVKVVGMLIPSIMFLASLANQEPLGLFKASYL